MPSMKHSITSFSTGCKTPLSLGNSVLGQQSAGHGLWLKPWAVEHPFGVALWTDKTVNALLRLSSYMTTEAAAGFVRAVARAETVFSTRASYGGDLTCEVGSGWKIWARTCGTPRERSGKARV